MPSQISLFRGKDRRILTKLQEMLRAVNKREIRLANPELTAELSNREPMTEGSLVDPATTFPQVMIEMLTRVTLLLSMKRGQHTPHN